MCVSRTFYFARDVAEMLAAGNRTVNQFQKPFMHFSDCDDV